MSNGCPACAGLQACRLVACEGLTAQLLCEVVQRHALNNTSLVVG